MERNQEGELFRQVLRSCQNPNNKLRCFCVMCLTLSSERVVKKKKKKSVMIVVLGVFFCFFLLFPKYRQRLRLFSTKIQGNLYLCTRVIHGNISDGKQ